MPGICLGSAKTGETTPKSRFASLFVATVALRRLWTLDYNLGGAHAAVVLVLVVAVIVVLRPWSLIPFLAARIHVG